MGSFVVYSPANRPPPLQGGEGERLRTTGPRSTERPKAVPEGRAGWGGDGFPHRPVRIQKLHTRSAADRNTSRSARDARPAAGTPRVPAPRAGTSAAA